MTDKPKAHSLRIPSDRAHANGRKPSAAECEWEKKTLQPALAKSPERAKEFTTVSSYPINRLYTPADLADWDADRDLGLPGQPPYTRGI
ncbi:MAG: methylmalonyl-CoA mutase, partial [Candidatus Acidiferrales bacterium]